MAISTLYIPAFSINTLITDKATGLPLSGGVVTFYEDEQRATLKSVWQITGTSPNYTFTELPNPMTLSSIGSFVDALGNPVVPYFYPYSASGALELYYVTVESSAGVTQFTREAVPYVAATATGVESSEVNNAISNPQFVETFQYDNGPITYNVTGSSTVTSIAPDWVMITTGTGTVTVTRLNNLGSGVDSDPPYALKIESTGISADIQIRQRINNSPRLFANQNVSAYASVSVTSASSIDFVLNYTPSTGTSIELINATVPAGVGFYPVATNVPIDGTINTDNADNGYVDIIAVIPALSVVAITSIQVSSTGDADTILGFSQISSPRQVDQLFHYYNPLLQYKPIPSYLVGWDFPLNPKQFNSGTIASTSFNIGANKSQYVWDQTIVFQTVDQGTSVAPTSTGALEITAALEEQFAVVQYLDQEQTRNLLLNPLSVMVSGLATNITTFTVSLWYTAAALPVVTAGTNNSIVATLDSNGYPATLNGTWTEVSRTGGVKAQAQLLTTVSDVGLSGWNIDDASGSTTATSFAIVVGFSTVQAAASVTLNSISLVPGQIPTPPAVKTFNETLMACQYYYQKSFGVGTAPANNAGTPNCAMGIQGVNAGGTGSSVPVRYATPVRKTLTPTLYNPSAGASGQMYNPSTTTSWTGTASSNVGANGFIVGGTSPGGSSLGQQAYIHWVADARLGILP